MTRISDEILINAPKNKVWEIISDLGGIENYHPGVKKSYYTSEIRKGVGASRFCELLPMGSIEESATEWEEGEGYVLEVLSGEKLPPFKRAYIRIFLKEEGQETLATISFDYTLKFGPIGRLLDAWKVKPMFRKVIPRVLDGLKQNSENGGRTVPSGK
ncbi:MAG: SRPBCC family protein [Candidatus Binatia bacterium]